MEAYLQVCVFRGADLHINTLEMRAFLLVFHTFQEHLVHHIVALMYRNAILVAYINKQEVSVRLFPCWQSRFSHG